MPVAFPAHIRPREAAELRLDERNQLLKGCLVAVVPSPQEPGDLA
jgi:hypothetical protein